MEGTFASFSRHIALSVFSKPPLTHLIHSWVWASAPSRDVPMMNLSLSRFANSLNPFLAQKRQVGQKPDRKTMRSCQFQNFPKLQVKRGLATRQLQKEFSLRPVAQDVGKLL
jgi:hypothetical protein